MGHFFWAQYLVFSIRRLSLDSCFYLRQGSRISISKQSTELAAGIDLPYRGADYRMTCSPDGSGVSVKAIYLWANDDNSEWTDYVSHMLLHTDPELRQKGRLLLLIILGESSFFVVFQITLW